MKDCLNNSLQYRLVKVEHALLQLLRPNQLNQIRKAIGEIDNASTFKDTDWSELNDNRDLNVFWFMDSESKRLTKTDVENSLGRELVLLKARCLIGRWISAAVNSRYRESGKESGDDTGYDSGASEGGNAMEDVAKEMEALLSIGAPVGRRLLFSDPPPSRLDNMYSLRYFQPLIYQARMTAILLGESADPDKVQHYLNLIYIYYQELCDYMSKTRRDPCSRGSLINTAVLFLEHVGLSSILVKVLDSLFSPATEKKNKKKKDQQEESMCWKEVIVADLKQCVVSDTIKVIEILRREQKAWCEKPVAPPLASINLEPRVGEYNDRLESCASRVTRSITLSHTRSLETVLTLLTEHLNLSS